MVAKKTTFIIIDAQSAGNTGLPDTKGYDAGKKVSGIRRHIVVDTNGLPHAIAVTAAGVTGRNGGLPALSCRAEHLSGVKKVLVDGGYTGKPFADGVADILPDVQVEVAKRNELKTFAVIPQHWVVERSFGWLDKCRRHLEKCRAFVEQQPANDQYGFFIDATKKIMSRL